MAEGGNLRQMLTGQVTAVYHPWSRSAERLRIGTISNVNARWAILRNGMMFVLLGLCACLGTAMAHAQQGPPMQLFGFERMRCSAWLADHRMEIEGETWVIAFWAGMNFENARSHQVGLGMNMKSIWDAVKQVCRDEPATTVLDATIRTYNRLQGQ